MKAVKGRAVLPTVGKPLFSSEKKKEKKSEV